MKARVQKWGNSLALRIPKTFATEAGLEQDSPVELSLLDGNVVVTPAGKRKYTLKQLLAQVRDDNLHEEVSSGPAVGRETL